MQSNGCYIGKAIIVLQIPATMLVNANNLVLFYILTYKRWNFYFNFNLVSEFIKYIIFISTN